MKSAPTQAIQIKRYALIIALIWTLLILALAISGLLGNYYSTIELARIEARATFNKDTLYRRWASQHGGVYVPITDETQPNPYLNVPNRDITTTDGLELTLINPAYMTRQVHELGRLDNGIYGHITSLNPIRPENVADAWETEALLALEQEAREVSSLEVDNGQPVLRYMQAFLTEESCLKCHADQGYELGDVRGGISVTVPMQPYWDAHDLENLNLILSDLILWLVGMVGIGFSFNKILEATYRTAEATQRLEESEARFRSLIQSQTTYVIRTDIDGNYTYVNPAFAEAYGVDPTQFEGTSVLETIDVVDHQKTYQATADCMAHAGQPVQVRLRKVLPDKRICHTLWEFIALKDHDEKITEIQCVGIDITKQVELEESLRITEERYRSAVHASLDAFYLMECIRDKTGEIKDFYLSEVNDIALKQVRGRREELVGKRVSEILPDFVIDKFFSHYKSVVETGQPIEEEFYIPEAEIFSGWYRHQIVKVDDGVAIVNRDITHRKQMEESLKASELRHRMTIKGTRAGTWEWNVQTGETVFNERWAEIVGYTLEELAPISIETWISLTHPDDLALSDQLLKKHFSGELSYYECEARMQHKDGHWVCILDRGMVMEWTEDGKPLRMYGTHVDVTERKQMEAHLLRSEERLRTIIGNIPIMISFFDEAGRFEFVNQYWIEALGWTAEELSSFDDPMSVFYPDADYRQKVVDFMLSTEPGWQDFETLTKSGDIIITTWANIRLSDGRAIGIGQDVTEIRKSQEQELALKLERERHHLLTTFFQNAAHEFRTPLATISSGAYLMSRSDDAENRVQRAKQIDTHVSWIARLVDSLLLMTRLESREALAIRPIDPGMLLRTACDRLTSECHKKHDLHYEIQPNLPVLMGDEEYLLDAIYQILDNACRFTPEGGKIIVKAGKTEDHVYIEVVDNGPGIRQDEVPHIFETFWRHDTVHSTPGFGLGLSIAQKIIERHDGKISVESVEGQGSTFRIILPLPVPLLS